jgi:HD-GYP domain-containing protein (c-di-GMP phosphodiesterase class II)
MTSLPRATRLLLGATAVVAVCSAMAAVALVPSAHGPAWLWIAFAVTAGFGETLAVSDGDDGSTSTNFTFSACILVAAAALFGPAPAGLIAASALGVVDLVRGENLVKLAFNAAAYAIAGTWAAIAYALAGGTPAIDERSIPGLVLLLLVHAVVQAVLVGAVVGSTRGLSPAVGIVRYVRHVMPPQVTEYSLAVILARLASAAPLFTPMLVPLLIAAFRAHARSAALQSETDRALRRLADIVDERDPYTFEHSQRVGELVRRLAEALHLSDRATTALARAGRLHDVGKIVVDGAILRKEGRLDENEFSQVRLHPAAAARLLGEFSFATSETRAVELHHERFDGTGYYHVAADEIPLSAHCLILADAWDAMTSDRPYRAGLSPDEAAARIEASLGTQFHPALGRAFLAVVEGRDPAEVVDSAQLRALRRGLDVRPSRHTLRSSVRRVRAIGPEAMGRTLVACAALCVGSLLLVPEAANVVLPASALCVAAAAALRLRALGQTEAVRAALDGLPERPRIADLVSALDERFGVLWAGVVVADHRGALVRDDASWRSSTAPTAIEAAVDGALRRIATGLHPGASRTVTLGTQTLAIVAQGDDWLAVVTERPVPPTLLARVGAFQRPVARIAALREVAA